MSAVRWGMGFLRHGDHRRARKYFTEALEANPSNGEALLGLTFASSSLGDFEGAQQAADALTVLWPDSEEAATVAASMCLKAGNPRGGWQQFTQLRYRCDQRAHAEVPLYAGQRLDGLRVLMAETWGYGDAIQFVRFAQHFTEQGAHVVVECWQPLARLMRTAKGVAEVVTVGEPLPPLDCEIPISLALLMAGATAERVPGAVPYLSAPEPIAPLEPAGAFHVGLVWACAPNHPHPERSLYLADLAPLAKVAGVRFHSLQHGQPARQLAAPPSGLNIVDHGPGLSDFADSAALMARLDLVITVDTAAAHLAGALGVPLWVLLPHPCDWRWGGAGERTPWYPSARLFRQSEQGHWAPVATQIASQLALVRESAPSQEAA